MVCEVEVTVGPETYVPVAHASFTVGPISLKTAVRRGETAEQACLRASRRLEALQARLYRRALARYLTRLEDASERALRAGNRAP